MARRYPSGNEASIAPLAGRIVGSTVMAIQALAMLTLALAVIAVIVVVTLIFMGVHI